MPSIAPTDAPSFAATCSIVSFIGQEYKVPFADKAKTACYRFQLKVGGTVSVDLTDETCTNSSFTVSAVLALYDGVVDNSVVFIPGALGWSGELSVKEDSTATSDTFQIISLEQQKKTFAVNLVVPSCA